MALRQPLNFPATSYGAVALSSSKELSNSCGPVRLGRRRAKGGILSAGFCDQGHVLYYKSVFCSSAATEATEMSEKGVKSGKEKSMKKMKKRLKLLKGLSKDISTFSQMGFGLDCDGALVDQIKGNMITETTQVLLEQLEKMKAEEKESKRRIKEEKARLKAAARMQSGGNCKMSSSSSSESSDSECGEVVDMKSLKQITCAPPTTPAIPSIQINAEELVQQPSNVVKADDLGESCSVTPTCSKKIEVCIGGKCKKSGAGAVLEELQRVVGMESAVAGCKCMGKCRDGPNVKVMNMEKNSLCIGVGLEDVNAIVANFLGEDCNQQQLGFAAAT